MAQASGGHDKQPSFSARTPTMRIDILTFPGGQLLDVAGPLQAFASCNDLLAERGHAPPYALQVVARGGGPVAMSSGLTLTTADLTIGAAADTLIVAGGRGVGVLAAAPGVDPRSRMSASNVFSLSWSRVTTGC